MRPGRGHEHADTISDTITILHPDPHPLAERNAAAARHLLPVQLRRRLCRAGSRAQLRYPVHRNTPRVLRPQRRLRRPSPDAVADAHPHAMRAYRFLHV